MTMNIADRLGTQVKDVLSCARHEALKLNHPFVEPEHLLLGLVHLGAGEGGHCDVLGLFEVSYHQFHAVFEDNVVADPLSHYSQEPLIGSKAFQRLVEAAQYATSQGRGMVQPQDLLYALVNTCERSCPAYQTLYTLGITTKRLEEVLKKR